MTEKEFEADEKQIAPRYSAKIKDLVIPQANSLADAAFLHNQLTSVVIPNNVSVVSSYAFADNKLTNVTIPSNVRLGYEAINDEFNSFYDDKYAKGEFINWLKQNKTLALSASLLFWWFLFGEFN